MSFGVAISHALSTLAAAGRGATVVSDNIANAADEDFAKRELVTAPRKLGGVSVLDVRRDEDTQLTGELRFAGGKSAGAEVSADALRRVEQAFGEPTDPGSLSARLAEVEATLVDAAADPSAEVRLRATKDALADLTRGLGDASDTLQTVRTQVESGIGADIVELNERLNAVVDLNARIWRGKSLERDVNTLYDQRRAEIDAIARIAPVRMVERPDGMVTLIAEGGVTLVDRLKAAPVEYTANGLVTAEMELGAGLDPVTVRGRDIDPTAPGGRLSGGTLEARLRLRDETLPEVQTRLDGAARDLALRLGATAGPELSGGLLLDPGAVAGDPPAPGLAGRLTLNPAVDPAQGGDLRVLRDGLGNPAGPVGNSQVLRDLAAALSDPRAAPMGFNPGQRTSADLFADVLSGASATRLSAEARAARAGATLETLEQQQRARGVDTDVELQRLLDIERSYAAGTRVIQTVDAMLDRLMEI